MARLPVLCSQCSQFGRICCFVWFFIVFPFLLPAYDALPANYKVRKGDTLYSLARRYGVSVQELMQANGLQGSSDLKLDMLLKVPQQKSEDKQKKESDQRHEALTEAARSSHTVVRGDTYYSIAKRYAMKLQDLLSLNRLDAEATLRLGQVLTVRFAAAQQNASRKENRADSLNEKYPEESYFWPVSGKRDMLAGGLQGVRISALDESFVYAVQSGRVIWQGPYRNYGLVALLANADGHVYLYGGDVHFLVNIGQEIRTGDPLGKVDTSNALAGRRFEMAREPFVAESHGKVYFSVFYQNTFVPVEAAPRGSSG